MWFLPLNNRQYGTAFALTLALGVVATDDEGTVVAYAAFSQVKIEKNINDPEWVALAPLAVEENWRGQGCGSALVINALNTLNDFGYAGVVVLGDPAYYNKLGFTSAASYQLWCRWPGSEVRLLFRFFR